MKKNIKTLLFIFLLIVFAKSSIDGRYFTVQSVKDIMIPFIGEYKILSFILLCMNIGLSYLFLYFLLKIVDSFFEMESYIITRATNIEFYKTYLKHIFKEIIILTTIFFISGSLFTLREGEGILIILKFSISLFLTLTIWANGFFLLKVYGISMKKTFFVVFSTLIISQILSKYYSVFSLLVIGSLYFKEKMMFIFVGKAITIMIFIILCCLRIKTYEAYGGKDD